MEKTKTIFERLGIAKERGMFLAKKCDEIYVAAVNNKNERKDSIDIISEARELSQNASEDILICFLTGVKQGEFLERQRQNAVNQIAQYIFGK